MDRNKGGGAPQRAGTPRRRVAHTARRAHSRPYTALPVNSCRHSQVMMIASWFPSSAGAACPCAAYALGTFERSDARLFGGLFMMRGWGGCWEWRTAYVWETTTTVVTTGAVSWRGGSICTWLDALVRPCEGDTCQGRRGCAADSESSDLHLSWATSPERLRSAQTPRPALGIAGIAALRRLQRSRPSQPLACLPRS